MNFALSGSIEDRFLWVSKGTAEFAVIIGAAVIIAWLFGIELLKSVFPGLPTMKVNTALCFIFSGLALRFYHSSLQREIRVAVRLACSGIVLLIAILTLLEYLLSIDFGIDQLFVIDQGTDPSDAPGRMSSASAMCFLSIGLSLSLLEYSVHVVSQVFALFTMLLSSAALIGYAYGVNEFIAVTFSSMAVHTSVLFVVLGMGSLLALPNKGLMAVIGNENMSGQYARAVIPQMVFYPLLLGWICLYGVLQNKYGTRFGFALNSLSGVTLLVLLVWRHANRLNQMQAQIAKADEEKALLASIVENSNDAIFSSDLDGTIKTWNAAATRIYGYSDTEMIDSSVSKLMPEKKRNERDRILNAIRAGKGLEHLEMIHVHRDGHKLDMSITVSPIRDEQGNIMGASNIARDVTERKKADERIKLAVEAAPNAMVMVDRHGRIVFVNSQAEKTFGYVRSELVGQMLEVLVPNQFKSTHPLLRAKYDQKPTSRPMGADRELFALHRDGTEFPVEIGLNPIETSDGNFVLAAIVDITKRKQSEREIQAAHDELLRSNRDLEQFAYVASHDLQEPLRAVSGCVQLLQQRYQGRFDEKADQFMQHAVDGAARMQTLIDDLLMYSRVGRPDSEFEASDCNFALHTALKNLEMAIKEADAKIEHDELPVVWGIRTQLVLLFQNLISNAVKFRRPDIQPRIKINVERQDTMWKFSIEDNGIGIDPQYFERIFVIFQRLHSRREYPGTGIGLSLCKRIVEFHGGRIWIEAAPSGQGIVMFFLLKAVKNTPRS